MKKTFKRIVCFSMLGLMPVLATQVHASGYKMEFQSASVLGDAGEAAVVEDAGTNWYNSAGLVYLPRQLVVSGIGIYAPTKFSGTAMAPSALGPAFNFTATGSATSHPTAMIPSTHFSLPINDRWAFGISVAPAWGFIEDYGLRSIVRYDLTRIYTKSFDIAPSIAYKINHQWSVGLGTDSNYFYASSRSNVNTVGPAGLGGTAGDSIARYSADAWGYGWHAGVLFRPTETTRVGLNYRSKIVMHLGGTSTFGVFQGPIYETRGFGFNIPLPPVTTLSAYHDMTPRWAMMGTISYDQWNVLQAYVARNYIQPPTLANPSGLINVTAPQNMSNTIDLSVGTHYTLNEQWMLRGSVKFEPTPTNSHYRDVNFPDGDKLGFQIGSRYSMNKKVAFDFLYGHVFTRSTHINNLNPASLETVVGHSHTNIDLLGAQVVWNI